MMDFNTAKRFDRWIGVLICYLLSLFDVLPKLFCRKQIIPSVSNPQKILFIGLAEIGSNLLACGALQKALEEFPGAKTYFLTFEENKEVLEILGIIDPKNVFTIRSKNFVTLFTDTVRFISAIRREHIEVVIDFELFSRFSAILSYLSGACIRIGFDGYAVKGLYRGNLLTHQLQFNAHRHISENFLSLVKAIKTDPSNGPLLKDPISENSSSMPRLEFSSAEANVILEKIRKENPKILPGQKMVVLNPENKLRLPLRSWPLENYQGLAQSLLELPNVVVVIIGVGEGGSAFDIKSDRCINLVGKTSLRELLSLFCVSSVMVSHDSGAVHLASLTDIEIVALFGPETPLLYGPRQGRSTIVSRNLFCSPCFSPFNYRTSVCRDNQCMKQITVDEIFEIVKEKLDRSRG